MRWISVIRIWCNIGWIGLFWNEWVLCGRLWFKGEFWWIGFFNEGCFYWDSVNWIGVIWIRCLIGWICVIWFEC